LLEHLLALIGAIVAAALATRVAASLARRLGLVSRVSGDRWGRRSVPLGGGVAIFLVLAPGLALLSWDLLIGATCVFLLGLVDDLRSLAPPTKLAAQTVAAAWMVAGPLDPGAPALLFSGPQALALPVTVAWYVGMANSVNLLDNMDGSAAGICAIAGAALFVLAVGGGAPDPAVAASLAVFVGAALGFLCFNFPPAKVFMGDAGSLTLGFVLADLAVRIPRGDDAGVRELAVAAFVLGIPLFDTALVWFGRRAARRPFLQGGKDHTAHRLVALGLSERRTLAVLYGAAATLGGLGIAVARGGIGTAVIAAVVAGVALILVGVFLGEVPVYEAKGEPPPELRPHSAMLYGVELVVDVGVISAAWLGAYAIRFEAGDLAFYLTKSALPALPFVISIKVLCLLLFGLYRGRWRTVGFRDVVAIGKATILASALVVVTATALMRFEDFSRGVIAIDAVLTLAAVTGSRSAYRLLRHLLAGLAVTPKRAVLLGPEALADVAKRALEREPLELVGVVDPGANGDLVEAIVGQQAEVALLVGPSPELEARLRAAGVDVRRLKMSLD
jgi:UDP-GlcNAc:undecaprenyl-phosphate GlcNAc-1-phosphate transferase